jgi:hypothetical protein
MDDVKPQQKPSLRPRKPLSPEQQLDLMRRARALWKHPSEEMIAEIQRDRTEWDQP